MKRREVMQIVGKTLGGLFVAQFVPGCKPPSGPSPIPPKPPDPINYYHFEITSSELRSETKILSRLFR
jgi:hypothetical protein